MTDQNIVAPDRHGRLPRMHYDAKEAPSPTTRADIVAWCLAQRGENGIQTSMRWVSMAAMNAVMRGKADRKRIETISSDMIGAMEAAADDIHRIVREYGYDPTGVNSSRPSASPSSWNGSPFWVMTSGCPRRRRCVICRRA